MEIGEMYVSMKPLSREISISGNMLYVECSEVVHIFLYNGGMCQGRLYAVLGESLTCGDLVIDKGVRYIRGSIQDTQWRWTDTWVSSAMKSDLQRLKSEVSVWNM